MLIPLIAEANQTLKDTETGYYLTLHRTGFADDKEYKKFIKNVERLVRGSIEYREWVQFVKFTLGFDYCLFSLETDAETDDIEIHHHPFTLYDIVDLVTAKYIQEGRQFTSLDIAKETLKLHYELKIGFVPLSGTLHKKYHKGNLSIPREFIYGNYNYLLQNYPLTDELRAKVSSALQVSLENLPENLKLYPGIKLAAQGKLPKPPVIND